MINYLKSQIAAEKRKLRKSGIPRRDRIGIIRAEINRRCMEQYGRTPTDKEYITAYNSGVVYKPKGKRAQKHMVNMPYTNYLTSNHWISYQHRVFDERGLRCEQCGRRSGVHLYHISYDNIPHEQDPDVILLCCRCADDRYRDGLLPNRPTSISMHVTEYVNFRKEELERKD